MDWLSTIFGKGEGKGEGKGKGEGYTITFLHIFVQTPAGLTIKMEVQASDSIDHVKARLTQCGGRRLFFAGRVLLDGFVSDYNIQHESTLTLK